MEVHNLKYIDENGEKFFVTETDITQGWLIKVGIYTSLFTIQKLLCRLYRRQSVYSTCNWNPSA